MEEDEFVSDNTVLELDEDFFNPDMLSDDAELGEYRARIEQDEYNPYDF